MFIQARVYYMLCLRHFDSTVAEVTHETFASRLAIEPFKTQISAETPPPLAWSYQSLATLQ